MRENSGLLSVKEIKPGNKLILALLYPGEAVSIFFY